MKKLLYISLIFVSTLGISQTRFKTREFPAGQVIELRGTKMFFNNEQIPSYEIKNYLKDNDYKSYSMFKKAKSNSALGSFFLGLGGALIIGDGVKALVSDVNYPSAMTYIGGGLSIISIPLLNNKNKKLKSSIDNYNAGLKTTGNIENNLDTSLNISANQNGVGLKFTF